MVTQVDISDRNPDGRGRGSLDGRAVLVSQAHPGETVDVRVDKSTRGTLQGRVSTIVTADPHRIAHSCPHEFLCTGCPLLAASPEDEEAFKLEKIRAAAGDNAPKIGALVRPSALFGYRYYTKRVFGIRKNRVILGSYVTGTHWVQDNAGCPILAPALASLMDFIADVASKEDLPVHREGRVGLRYATARQSKSTGKQMLVVVASGADVAKELVGRILRDRPEVVAGYAVANREAGDSILSGEWIQVSSTGALRDEMMGFQHSIDPRSFFQINPEAAHALFRAAAQGAGAGEVCLEGYAGVGALTLPLAKAFGQVIAVERVSESAEALRGALVRAALSNVRVVEEDVSSVFPHLLAEYQPRCIVLDPPRKGAPEALMGAVGSSSAERIVLLSCDPQTLARDLPRLIQAGFQVERITAVDQFPRTAHVETVTTLIRGNL